MSEQTTITLDGLTAIVSDDDEDYAPWNDGWLVYRYGVRVDAAEGQYECPAWGSRHDYERDERDREGIGWMVLGELLSAAYDPDEFWTMAMDGSRPDRELVQRVMAELDAAQTLLPALERNADVINDHA